MPEVDAPPVIVTLDDAIDPNFAPLE